MKYLQDKNQYKVYFNRVTTLLAWGLAVMGLLMFVDGSLQQHIYQLPNDFQSPYLKNLLEGNDL